jgi:DNA-binding GntR family transcriptional regulator
MRSSVGLDDAAGSASRTGNGWSSLRARPTSSQVAARYIREQIFEGRLRPGQRIPQDEVANALGLSRIPVREAIVALEREGFVTTQLHRGAFVSALDEQAVRDQYELYGRVYGFAATRALERSDGTFIDDLRAIQKRLADSDDPARFGDLALEFNRTVVTAAASPRIKLIIRSMPGVRPSAFFTLVPDAIPVMQRGTNAVLRALERGDGTKAADRYVALMTEIGEHVVALFHERELFTADSDRA